MRVDIAFMEQNPAKEIGVTGASAPPAIMSSASEFWMIRNASPTACAPEEHADTVQ